MHAGIYTGALVALLILFFLAMFLFRRKKYTYTSLYAEGIKNENNGFYKAALVNYNNALAEVEKYKFHEKMKTQLTEKIKILKSAIEYESH
jgi:hypothetical protein